MIKHDFKELLSEFESLQTKYKAQEEEYEANVSVLQNRLDSLASDKNELAESLDLTRVQFKDEASKFEDEKSILLNEHKEKLLDRVTELISLMREMGVNIDQSQTAEGEDESNDFGEVIESCRIAFQNYQENKTALQELIDEREEIAREKEDMGFELAGANAELDLLRRKFEMSDTGKLSKQITTMGEES